MSMFCLGDLILFHKTCNLYFVTFDVKTKCPSISTCFFGYSHSRRWASSRKDYLIQDSGIDVGPSFNNFGFFSKPYGLIREYIKVI